MEGIKPLSLDTQIRRLEVRFLLWHLHLRAAGLTPQLVAPSVDSVEGMYVLTHSGSPARSESVLCVHTEVLRGISGRSEHR